MNHALPVRRLQRFADLHDERQRLLRCKPRPAQNSAQIRAVHVFHHEIEMPLARLTEVMHRDDSGMVQFGQRARFAPEPLHESRVGGHFRR